MAEGMINFQTEALLGEFTRSGLRELHIRGADFEIFLSNDPASGTALQSRSVPSGQPAAPVVRPLATSASPPAPKVPTDLPPDALIVRAPNLGTFYGAPKPGADAYVTAGSMVKAGAELCLIEVMKLFTTVRAEFDGRIHAILAEDGAMVEAGQPLFALARN